MAYSKIKKISFILLCCFVLIFPFWCVKGLCAEIENVDFNIVDGISITSNSNAFISNSNGHIGYFQTEKGYIYYIKNNLTNNGLNLATSDDIPSLNVPYNYIMLLSAGDTYTYVGDGLLYFDFGTNTNGSAITVTREKINNQEGTINELVSNVGPNAIWGIFEIAIDYIWVVVLVAFGIFLISVIIRKLSKGKGGM